MIKLIREGSRKYPWILIGIMVVIVVAFVVGMGWWGFVETPTNRVASIGDVDVTLDEYRQIYQNVSQFYRDNDQGEVSEEQIRQVALQSLLGTKIWSLAAADMGMSVSPEELRGEILKRKEFYRNGKFDPEYYRRLLAINRMTPALFEAKERERLSVDKARTAVAASVALTPSEKSDAQALVAGQSLGTESDGLPAEKLIVQTFLYQKRQRALEAFTEALKAKYSVKVYEENF